MCEVQRNDNPLGPKTANGKHDQEWEGLVSASLINHLKVAYYMEKNPRDTV